MARPIIVLIDDDKFMRKFLALALGKNGYEVIEADDGASGLAFIQQKKPDGVICDQVMPGIPGHEVLAKMRGIPEHRTTPFLLLSGDDVPLPKEAGAHAMKKPVNAEKLNAWLAKCVPLKSAA